jgi:hypothetical protein
MFPQPGIKVNANSLLSNVESELNQSLERLHYLS